MRSIRKYLFISLLSAMTVVMSVSGIYAYYSSVHEIDELFDAQLAQYARLIQESGKESGAAKHSSNIHNNFGHNYEEKISFQVWDINKNLISNSDNTNSKPIGPFQAGYFNISQNDGSTWKVFVMQDTVSGFWYMTSESLAIRMELVGDITRAVFFPIIVGVFIALLLIRVILWRGLVPLKTVGDAITRRQAGDLSRLEFRNLPVEVSVLVDDINYLLGRVGKSLDRERRFSADAAHEIKTPLASLKLHLANLESDPDSNIRKETLVKAIRSCNEIQRLIEQLLTFNRLEPQYFASTRQPVELNALCRYVLSEEAEFSLTKQQVIRFDGADEKIILNSNDALLQMLLRNLVHNAIQYTQPGGMISLRAFANNQSVVIEVEDNGPGIPVSQRSRVFDRFYRLDGDKHASGIAGSGLGLAIVKELVELHDGSIQLADGESGNGLRVIVQLPL